MALAVAVGGVLGIVARPSPITTPVTPPVGPSDADWMLIHVSGAVVSPGVAQLAAGSTVAAAIAAAGGLTPDAAVESINLAAVVADGDQVVVPERTGDPVDGGQVMDGPLSINSATASELEELPGVGPVLAQRIVAYREQSGRFERIEDLLEVPGIGESKLAAIRDLIRVP